MAQAGDSLPANHHVLPEHAVLNLDQIAKLSNVFGAPIGKGNRAGAPRAIETVDVLRRRLG